MTTSELKKEILDLISGTQKITHYQGDLAWSDSRLEVEEAVDQILALFTSQQEEMRRKIEKLKIPLDYSGTARNGDQLVANVSKFQGDLRYNQAIEDILALSEPVVSGVEPAEGEGE